MLILLMIACNKPTALPAPRRVGTEDGLSAELVSEGALSDRVASPDDAALVLFYTGEQNADLEPCGCTDTPRGGLSRTAAYIATAGAGIVINGAGWLDEGQSLDGSPMEDAKLKNQWMIQGLTQLGVDVVHIGFGDLIGLSRMASPPGLPMVSANLRGPGIETHRVVDHQGHRVGVSGISQPGHISIVTPGYERLDPLEAARPIIKQLSEDSDFIVLLNNGATDAAKKLLREEHVDIVIETAHHRGFEAPFRQGSAIWVRSHDKGLRLGELRVEVDPEHGMRAHDRKIDLDKSLPGQPEQIAIAEDAARELKALDRSLFAP